MAEEIRLVLLGKTGCGKSATGNSIFGSEKFQTKLSGSSVTHVCSQNYTFRFEKKIVIVDTPGIFDTEESNEKVQEEIYKCIGITSPGPHAFILVINTTERYTNEEDRTVEHFVKYFGENVHKYFIVLFTRKDELDAQSTTLADYIQSCPSKLRKFIEKCGNRALAFDNNLKGIEQDKQVKQLIDMTLENVKTNVGTFYTNEMYIEAEGKIVVVEEEKMHNAKKKLEEEWKRIEENQNEQLKGVESQIKELTQKQDRETHEIGSIKNKIQEYERKLEMSTATQKKEIQYETGVMRRRLQTCKETKFEREQEIEKHKRASLDLCALHHNEREEFKRKLDKDMSVIKETVRDDIRKTIEEKSKATTWSECTIF